VDGYAGQRETYGVERPWGGGTAGLGEALEELFHFIDDRTIKCPGKVCYPPTEFNAAI
jgi:hypothetical protein